MKVLLPRGAGAWGNCTAQLLAREKQITEITVTSGHLETAQQSAQEIGGNFLLKVIVVHFLRAYNADSTIYRVRLSKHPAWKYFAMNLY